MVYIFKATFGSERFPMKKIIISVTIPSSLKRMNYWWKTVQSLIYYSWICMQFAIACLLEKENFKV